MEDGFGRPPAGARAAAMLRDHGSALQAVARRWSVCQDDAEDAVQRGLEIYLRRADTLAPATELAWLKVVIKHEALAVRRARQVAADDVDLDARPDDRRSVEERYEAAERVGLSAQALRALKHDEALALLLKAEGHSYHEIGARLRWTYTKVNRCITEGRRRFREAYADLESGAECERHAAGLAALARGSASAETLLALRPHLRACAGCRATVRALHGGGATRRAAAVAVVLAPGRWLVQRLAGSDVAQAAVASASGGGGRGVGVAALVGLCLGGAGTWCTATGELPGLPAGAATEAIVKGDAPRRARPAPARVKVTAPARAATPAPPRAAAQPAPRRRTPPRPAPRPRTAPAGAELSFEAASGRRLAGTPRATAAPHEFARYAGRTPRATATFEAPAATATARTSEFLP